MSEQTIQSRDIRVADVFQDFYVVPDYQREYVWGTEQVEQLLNDINGELAGADPAVAPEYFIGSIVVCPGRSGVLDLIDGQQRMTTLCLTLCAIRDRIRELGAPSLGPLDLQIAASSIDVSGNEVFRYRLDLQYEDSGDVLVQIAKGRRPPAGRATRSITNLLNAYDTVLAFLRREFVDDVARVRAFYAEPGRGFHAGIRSLHRSCRRPAPRKPAAGGAGHQRLPRQQAVLAEAARLPAVQAAAHPLHRRAPAGRHCHAH